MATAVSKLLVDRVPHLKTVPINYIRPTWDRPDLLDLQPSAIPIIDLHGLSPDHRSSVIAEIAHACENCGFFQVMNHGIPEDVIRNMIEMAREFFKLPVKDRIQMYSEDTTQSVRLSTSFNVKMEKVSNWRDFLRMHCFPLEDHIQDFPSNPPAFRERVGEYCKLVRELAMWLLEAISESLGLDGDYIERMLGKHEQHMAINFYPPCPQPELTYGLPAHTDPNAITLLLPDSVPGLQVLKNDKWLTVQPPPNTFIINIGDQIQVISNGRYKSILHRALVNSEHERISIPTFFGPSFDSVIQPASPLVDEYHRAQYRSFTYGEYYKNFWNKELDTHSCLEMFR